MSVRSILRVWRYPQYVRILCRRSKQAWIVHRLRAIGVATESPVSFLGRPIVTMAPRSTVSIGLGSVICSESESTALGVNHACILRTLRPEARLLIGQGVRMSGTTICAAERVEIGDRVVIGANVTIVDTDFHALDPTVRTSEADAGASACNPVFVEDDVFIGLNATILKGVTVGRGSIVGAGAVVTRSCAPGSIVGGNPARVIGNVQK